MKCVVRQVQRVQCGHIRKRCWQLPDCRHGAVRLLARHLPAQRPGGSNKHAIETAGGDNPTLATPVLPKERAYTSSWVHKACRR